jgi:ribulose 1,5-bisphosphate synthetase/thiazole synthase
MYRYLFLISLFLLNYMYVQSQSKAADIDVCLYGGTSAGVIAAYTACKLNKKVLLIEPGNRLGGLSSGGLGFTDIGNKYVVTGLARDFYRRIGQHYGKFEQWTFEPKIADSIFNDYVKRGGFKVIYNHRLKNVIKTGNHIKTIVLESSLVSDDERIVINSKQFIDCSY